MSDVRAESATELRQRAAARLAALDPLLPPAVELPAPGGHSADCGLVFAAKGADGRVCATATCEHQLHEAESLNLIWGSVVRQFSLTPVLGGPEVAAPLDDLLTQWRDHLAGVPGPTMTIAPRSCAGLVVTSRGSVPCNGTGWRRRPLPRPGSRPAGRARRPRRRRAAGRAPGGPVFASAGPGRPTLDVVAELNLELVRYEAHFGNLRLRPWTERVLHEEAARMLAKPEPWAWLAERDGTAVGLLGATRPEDAAWIGAQVRLAPAAYLGEMFLRPAERGSGAAALLTRQFHDVVRAAGVAVTLLHYGSVNPLSGPFWSRQDYRPLWVTWGATPARTLR